MTELGLPQLLAAEAATLIIAFVKGAFGGGFGIVGIPILSLVMDPITAGAIMAPLFIPQDIFALRYYRPHTWSLPDLKVLIPALVVGIVLGTLLLSSLDARIVAITIAVVSLLFSANWYIGGQRIVPRPRNGWLAALAGTASGVTTMVAHAGAPPLQVYLLRLGLAKEVYAGTTTIYFTVGNLVKLWPWLWLGQSTPGIWMIIALCLPMSVAGVWLGWQLHKRLDQRRLYQICYALLVVTSLKLLWDGVRGFM